MKILFMALSLYAYGIYTEITAARFNRLILSSLAHSAPLTSVRLVAMSRKCYLKRLKFRNMSERLNLEIAKRRGM